MSKRSLKYIDKYCESTNNYVGVKYTRVESAESFQDIFPLCLHKEECNSTDCIFKVGESGKLYIDWPNKEAIFNLFSAS